MKQQYTLAELTEGLDVKINGDKDCIITGIATLQQAQPGNITFLNNSALNNSKYQKYLPETKASAVILTEDNLELWPGNAIVSKNPYFIYAKIANYFSFKRKPAAGVHASVALGDNCQIHESASVGPYCVISNNVVIEADVQIGSHSYIGHNCVIKSGTILDPRVTLYDSVRIGEFCHLSSGVVLGSDGFGFAEAEGEWHKVPQLGSVVLGNYVEIGANTTIDRGAIEDTIIEDGVKLDNLIQIGHNVKIGKNTIIAGCVGIAGSTTIGKNCMIGGASCLNGHITICDYAVITGMTAITKSITSPGLYSSGIVGALPNKQFLKNNAFFNKLESLFQRVKNLENKKNN